MISSCRLRCGHTFMLALAGAALSVGSLHAQTTGLVAAYSFDAGSGLVLADVSGQTNTLTLVNGPAWVPGRYGTALSFDGNNDRAVAQAYVPGLNLAGRSLTLSAWIYPRSNSSWQMIVLKPAGATHSAPYFDWSMHRQTGTGRIVGFFGCDAQQSASNAATPLNTWTHVAVTYDGVALRHYLNGTLDRTTPLTCAVANTSSQPIRIGANGGNGEVMNGSIDDVRIYNRALSPAEIQADMNSSAASPPVSDTTVPVVSMGAPQAGAVVSNTITVAATASDNTAVVGVQFRLDGANLGAEDVSAPYATAWSSATASNGPHALAAVARDAAGNAATSGAVAITTSNAVPVQTLGVAVGASPSSGPAPLIGVDLTASVTGTATGTMTYTFYCNRPDTGTNLTSPWDRQVTGSSQTAFAAADVCRYDASGTYTAKVIAQRAGLAAEARSVVTVAAAGGPVQATLSASPATVTTGGASNLTWTSLNATYCQAGGGWAGIKAPAGSASTRALTAATNTFTLKCSGASGSATASAVVTVSGGVAQAGLNFPGSAAVATTMRFRFFNPLAIFPATYIWRAYPRRQAGYYTAFFWGNDDGQENINTFLWAGSFDADSYYGAHPYPDGGSAANTHKWEISVSQADYVNGVVVYDRWYTQALRVWADASGQKHHEFYWDLPNTDAAHMVSRTTSADWGNRSPPVPALTWGDAPWAPGREVWNGILRGIQVYSANLSVPEILSEVSAPLSTGNGASNVWYLNLNPTPSDIADKSGAGHNPSWVGAERPTLWTGP